MKHISARTPLPGALAERTGRRDFVRLHFPIGLGGGTGVLSGSWRAPGGAVPYVDKRGTDVPNLHRDGRPRSEEDDFWILAAFLYGKTRTESFSVGQR